MHRSLDIKLFKFVSIMRFMETTLGIKGETGRILHFWVSNRVDLISKRIFLTNYNFFLVIIGRLANVFSFFCIFWNLFTCSSVSLWLTDIFSQTCTILGELWRTLKRITMSTDVCVFSLTYSHVVFQSCSKYYLMRRDLYWLVTYYELFNFPNFHLYYSCKFVIVSSFS